MNNDGNEVKRISFGERAVIRRLFGRRVAILLRLPRASAVNFR